jgi:hypothetical protein
MVRLSAHFMWGLLLICLQLLIVFAMSASLNVAIVY